MTDRARKPMGQLRDHRVAEGGGVKKYVCRRENTICEMRIGTSKEMKQEENMEKNKIIK
jgi:hypothetical protein